MAARAHDVASMALRGSSACLDFTDPAWLLPVPSSYAVSRAIQDAAADAARAFPVQTEPNTANEEEEHQAARTFSVRSEPNTCSAAESLPAREQTTVETSDPYLLEDMIELDMDLVMTEYYCYHAILTEGLLLVDPSATGDDDSEDDADLSLWSFPI